MCGCFSAWRISAGCWSGGKARSMISTVGSSISASGVSWTVGMPQRSATFCGVGLGARGDRDDRKAGLLVGGEMALGHDHAGADAADPVFLRADLYVRLEPHARHPFLPSRTGYNAMAPASAKPGTIISHQTGECQFRHRADRTRDNAARLRRSAPCFPATSCSTTSWPSAKPLCAGILHDHLDVSARRVRRNRCCCCRRRCAWRRCPLRRLAVGGSACPRRSQRSGCVRAARRSSPWRRRQAFAPAPAAIAVPSARRMPLPVASPRKMLASPRKVAANSLLRPVIDLLRRPFLHQPAVAQDADAVAHRQRFFLVVGDEDRGDADLALDALQLDLHVDAQRLVERAERLVEQQHARLGDDGAGQRHALALAAGKLVRPAAAELAELDEVERALHLAGDRRSSASPRTDRPKATLSATLILGNSA